MGKVVAIIFAIIFGHFLQEVLTFDWQILFILMEEARPNTKICCKESKTFNVIKRVFYSILVYQYSYATIQNNQQVLEIAKQKMKSILKTLLC